MPMDRKVRDSAHAVKLRTRADRSAGYDSGRRWMLWPRCPSLDVDREYRRHRRSVLPASSSATPRTIWCATTSRSRSRTSWRSIRSTRRRSSARRSPGLSIAYGISKFLMGSVSDRSNPKYFLSLGLLLSCAVMAVSGLVKAIYASLALVIALQTLNGWVQGMGWPPCGKTMVHWFSTQRTRPRRVVLERRAQRRRRAGRDLRAVGRDALRRLGREVLFQCRHRRGRRRGRRSS